MMTIKDIVRRKMLLPRTAWLWPDLNVLGSYPAPDMCAQGSTVGRPRDTKVLFTSFSIPAIVEIQHQVGTPLPLAAPQLNASPVTGGGGQCQFSCWKPSGAAAGLPISLSKGLR